jgi:predicted RNA-binding Zn ribbon-like protein
MRGHITLGSFASHGYSDSVTISPTLEELQEAGFPMGGEPSTALDLADTVMTVFEPPRDLLDDPALMSRWWELQSRRLPPGPRPELAATIRLRSAIRDLVDAGLEGRAPRPESVSDLNAFASAVPTSPQLALTDDGPAYSVRWHTEHGGNPLLATIAREAIDLLTDPVDRSRLRRCANPSCSMVFLAQNPRRTWCSSTGCGNRVRAARHYRRVRDTKAGDE